MEQGGAHNPFVQLQDNRNSTSNNGSSNVSAAAATAAGSHESHSTSNTSDGSDKLDLDLSTINSLSVVSALLATITFVGFTSAPGGTMPQGYPIVSQTSGYSQDNYTAVDTPFTANLRGANPGNLIFWYANSFSFYVAVAALMGCLKLQLSLHNPWWADSRVGPSVRLAIYNLIGQALFLSVLLAVVAFTAGAFVVLDRPHNLAIILTGLLCFGYAIIYGIIFIKKSTRVLELEQAYTPMYAALSSKDTKQQQPN